MKVVDYEVEAGVGRLGMSVKKHFVELGLHWEWALDEVGGGVSYEGDDLLFCNRIDLRNFGVT